MDPFQRPFNRSQGNTGPESDPRLRPTPDYGTLGPGSDIAGLSAGPNQPPRPRQAARTTSLIAALLGMFVAVVVGSIGGLHPAVPGLAKFIPRQQNQSASPKDLGQLDRMGPQKQAETLLQLAVANNRDATQQITSRVDRWQGQLHWDSQIATLTASSALNSNDMRVRESGVEVELAAYGLAKNAASLEYLLKTAESENHQQKVWALWALGLMANRGVEPEHVVEVLTTHLQDSDEDSRRWAVEGLALAGSDQTIEALLKTMHDDPSVMVRERAACALAESGMFAAEQRMLAVPRLLSYTDDPSLDAPTHAFAFHALRDITQQRLPDDPAAWRNWYESRNGQ